MFDQELCLCAIRHFSDVVLRMQKKELKRQNFRTNLGYADDVGQLKRKGYRRNRSSFRRLTADEGLKLDQGSEDAGYADFNCQYLLINEITIRRIKLG